MTKNAMVIREVLEMLKMSPLKLTSQRKKLIKIIFANGDGHYTAEGYSKVAQAIVSGVKNDQQKHSSVE